MDKDIEKLKKRIKFYFTGNIPVHIITETDAWVNGYIDDIYDDYLVILDRIDGDVKVFYTDIRRLDYFKGDLRGLRRPKWVIE